MASKLQKYGADALADYVVSAWVTKVGLDARTMRDNYLNGIQNADIEQAKRLLGLWYETAVPRMSTAFSNIWAGAPAPVRR